MNPPSLAIPAIVDHHLLSFQDADLILISAPDVETKQQTRFKVHKDVLCVYSSVFRDMVDSSRSHCAVSLQDSATAITSLLSYMHSATVPDLDTPTIANLRTMHGVARGIEMAVEAMLVADKYNIRNMQEFLEESVKLELQLLYTSIHPDDREDKDTIAETLFDRYTGELSFGDTVHLVSHGLKLHKEAIWRLALVVGRWLLLTDGNELKHHDLGKYKLSSAAELELWKYHYGQDEE